MKRHIDYIETGLKSFYKRLAKITFVSTDQLSFYRIFLGVYLLIFKPSYSWIGEVPPGLYRPNPLTITSFFQSLPSYHYFYIVNISVSTLLVMLVIGVRTRIIAFILFLILLTSNSFAYSFGKIDHSIFTPLILLYLSFTNSGIKYALLPDRKIGYQNQATSIFAICLAFAFFTAGFEKILNWVDFDLSTSGILSWYYYGYYVLDRDQLLAPYFQELPFWLMEIMDYSAVLFEITGLLFLFFSRSSWHIYLLLAAIFHLINTLILNIPFLNHLPVYGLWLLSPFLNKYKPALLTISFFIFFKGLLFAAIAWILFILTCVFSYKKKLYK